MVPLRWAVRWRKKTGNWNWNWNWNWSWSVLEQGYYWCQIVHEYHPALGSGQEFCIAVLLSLIHI